ncbi:alanine dehydrogenase [Enterococcus malodoratus]|uniref:Alanine dehydrogenase n=1 Tax=Enterococcus malodoratus ATCC 43197 TaxID=1158601 RepID=R2RHH1_9ENTE|nr:alanine dehydrogenase [Enterococcus malodoratus]EOH75439.1 alanine dehydrogenase [Enterococcus malodoratus ATCC 43197]EOT66902.1 alanine dehydrogenase [Enterococcus malodoratus ATCC 43197]OJG65800.1 alanine dehydrogenase [Enterococcus malodoratus]SET64823.1 alanine dehydrogenase [Enterococcus malodoratus]SPW90829.1 alanine dehydrogenase [Enterococcus malodoratus]
MIIGIPKEIKNNENRVALPPSGVFDLTNRGHQVLVEKDAGKGSAISDEEYAAAGATIIDNAADVWAAEMVMKVKEPLPEEYQYFRKGLLLFTYLHLAANRPLTEALVNSGVNAIAYENVQPADNTLPLLAPMSEIAGRMAAQIGANYLERVNGGKGILLSGVPGVRRGNVVVIGGGVVGLNAAKLALGLGANVTILDVSVPRLKELDIIFGNSIQTMMSNSFNIQECLKTADLVIGAVLIPGHKAPTLVTKEMVANIPDHSVIVDVAIDQGGIFETEDRVTTHDDPTYVKEGVVHYAVANMPGAVPQTATYALSNSTMAYANLLANNPLEEILKNDLALRRGVNTYNGKLTIEAVAKDLSMDYTQLDELLNEELMMNS